MKLPEGMSRLDLVRQGLTGNLPKRGRFIVSIARLKEDPDNERKTFLNLDGLIESVKTHGIVEPITVTAPPRQNPVSPTFAPLRLRYCVAPRTVCVVASMKSSEFISLPAASVS